VTPETAQAAALETTPVPTPDDGYTGPVGGNVGDRAAEIEGIKAWLNSEPLTLAGLRGKVVLVDFWTYTCINCIRTYPFLKLWNSRYADDGLVIIGVHSPEFEFEKDQDNVIRATQDDGIIWPVAMDNDFVTWRNYSNRFWPAKYLIDMTEEVWYTHFGEGRYAETEEKIRELLLEAGAEFIDGGMSLPSDQTVDATYLNERGAEVTRELYGGIVRWI
jgi:thiol-disulfide isomerase/thioredoxin